MTTAYDKIYDQITCCWTSSVYSSCQ